jgi:hypothetical protein
LFEDGSALKQGRQFQEFHNVFQKWRDIGLGKVNVKLLGEQVQKKRFYLRKYMLIR